MAHYPLVVATRSLEAIPAALAPFDENQHVEPHRRYIPGEPADFCTPAELRAELGLDPEDPTLTWAKLVAAYNDHYRNNPDWHLYLDDDGRPYEISTANPQARWDYWTIGGGWSQYFPLKDTASPTHPALITEPPTELPNGLPTGLPTELFTGLLTESPAESGTEAAGSAGGRIRVPGGPKKLLDLDLMREEAAAEAAALYDTYTALTAGLPEARPRSWFAAQVKRGERDIEQAQAAYRGQPRVQATAHLVGPSDCPIEEFGVPRDAYIHRGRGLAVPGYATLTLDGRWLTPGLMGRFAISTDDASSRAAYAAVADAYIDAVAEDVLLVAVDCHT